MIEITPIEKIHKDSVSENSNVVSKNNSMPGRLLLCLFNDIQFYIRIYVS